ncbi:MAG: VCBS repeat-containing protein [Myxococcota bacterium]
MLIVCAALWVGCPDTGLFVSGVSDLVSCDDGDPCTTNDRRSGDQCIGDFVCPVYEASTLVGIDQLPDGNALSVADFNRDGSLDVAVGRLPTDTSVIFVGRPGGYAPQFLGERHEAVLWSDLDNDGDLDLIGSGAASPSSVVYYRGGVDRFERLVTLGERGAARCSIVFDQNRDGWNDILVFETTDAAPSLNLNAGVNPLSFLPPSRLATGPLLGAACAATDIDGDGYTDVFLNTDQGGLLLRGSTEGFVRDQRFELPVVLNQSGDIGGAGTRFADFNGDGRVDGYFGGGVGQPDSLYLSEASGDFAISTEMGSTETLTLGVDAGDVDHDGDVDLVVATSDGALTLQRNNGAGVFSPVDLRNLLAPESMPRTPTLADMDRDGDLDVVVLSSPGPNALLRNRIDDERWVQVRIEGQGPPGSPRDAIGAQVALLDADDRILGIRETGYPSGLGQQLPQQAHFGLAADNVDRSLSVVVRFSSGAVRRVSVTAATPAVVTE